MSKLFTLSAKERLKSRKDIETLFREGKAFSVLPLRIMYRVCPEEEDNQIRFAASVPKKFFKKAVDRNRIRRQMKEAYRLQKNELKELLSQRNKRLHVLFVYNSKETIAYAEISKQVEEALLKLKKVVMSL